MEILNLEQSNEIRSGPDTRPINRKDKKETQNPSLVENEIATTTNKELSNFLLVDGSKFNTSLDLDSLVKAKQLMGSKKPRSRKTISFRRYNLLAILEILDNASSTKQTYRNLWKKSSIEHKATWIKYLHYCVDHNLIKRTEYWAHRKQVQPTKVYYELTTLGRFILGVLR